MTNAAAQALSKALSRAWEFALDTIAPPDPLVRDIERSGPSGFMASAAPSDPAKDIKGITAFFSYKDRLVKTAILEVKSYGNKRVARIIGEAAYECLLAELSDLALFKNFDSPLLTTIPMTRKALRKRGWNQCDLIAEGIRLADRSQSIEIRTGLLEKVRETGDQVGRSRSERLESLKGCFEARRPEAVQGRNVIVLDDIATTGATLGEARKALRRAGARRVWCVAIAH